MANTKELNLSRWSLPLKKPRPLGFADVSKPAMRRIAMALTISSIARVLRSVWLSSFRFVRPRGGCFQPERDHPITVLVFGHLGFSRYYRVESRGSNS